MPIDRRSLFVATVAASILPALVRALAQHAGPRWLAQADGSRRLAALVQLGEVLQCECGAGAGIAAQVVALERRASGPASPDAELRPEVGTDAVELLTVHKSKGLEWDVVFAPYLWSGRDEARDNSAIRAIRPVRFHRERGGLLVDLNGDGLLDMLVVNRWDKAQLWRNLGTGTADQPQSPGGWLQLRLRQPGCGLQGNWNDANNTVQVQGWVICSPNDC